MYVNYADAGSSWRKARTSNLPVASSDFEPYRRNNISKPDLQYWAQNYILSGSLKFRKWLES